MKSKFIATCLAAGACLSASATIKTTTKVDFGRKPRECQGISFCFFESTTSRSVTAAVEINTDMDTLSIGISGSDYDNLAADVRQAIMVNRVFAQGEPIELPRTLSSRLGQAETISIPIGNYQVRESAGIFWIKIPLSR